ncbi:Uncharacterized conserved protein YlxW, UPF0749 family [Mesobacillus persicus]|uniref:Uncharacterized conserved protein YlxW, UPF0749 family n=1 Tax=Mesobacillus persicus TaxID=930146 RepID=A0A1H8FBE9_9BACI|nr:DUF881 domain-containing protein [Mesobacillus persicus]SEN28896.1 Uncharacterized conserved protein YlxW, UPF0749 family [Mesobacillus persicus]
MGRPKNVYFTVTASIIGLMVAIQFQTVSEPEVRDTRDTWELRNDLMGEKELQSELLHEIRTIEDKLTKYENEREQSKEQLLKETLEELKGEAGLTEVTGPGIILTLQPIVNELGQEVPMSRVSPSLLQRLINELNMYGAIHLSVDEQRVINTTVIRDIGTVTKIDGHSLNRLPIQIKVITKNAEEADKLYKRMEISTVVEDFFIDNLRVVLEKPEEDIMIPGYQDTIRIRYMEPVETGVGGDG